MAVTEPGRYHVYIDYKGFLIDERSYRVFPAPLMGTRFSTGRMAYSNLDFWQVGALTDFTKGINQKFLVDSSQYYLSEGIDVSKEGELKLEKDLENQSFPSGVGYVTARYRSIDTLWLGTSTGKILKTTDGVNFTLDQDTGTGQIYSFYEMGTSLFATKGTADNVWKKSNGTWSELTWGNLFYVMVESDYAYGLFDEGIRQTTDGETWAPESPQKLWSLPASEGIALNAIPIPRGFLIGAKRGLWIFIGGGSAVNIWLFPEHASANNFKGMEKFGPYAVFSVEGQGLFYTDGSGIYPTNLNWQEEPLKIISCKSIITSGWDMFALVSDGTDWYLARSNMVNVNVPKFWWLVKKLSKTPAFLSSFDRTKLFIHYEDGTCQKYNKTSGPFQTNGYLISSFIDENLILLPKLYKSISALLSSFPSNTSLSLDYRLKEETSFPNVAKSFTGGGDLECVYPLPNPTLSTRIQIRLGLGTSNTAVSPVVTDLCWKYILERPIDETKQKKNFNFTILAEDILEKLDFGKEELGRTKPRTAQEIITQIWEIRSKKEILNFVGADNTLSRAFTLKYTGSGNSCLLKIDRTNYKLTTVVDGTTDQTIDYEDVSLGDLVDTLNNLTNYTCTLDPEADSSQSANNLFPVNDVELKGEAQVYLGTDVHAVIFNQPSPGQFAYSLTDRTSARIQISLREAD